jgi:hypothetical protein
MYAASARHTTTTPLHHSRGYSHPRQSRDIRLRSHHSVEWEITPNNLNCQQEGALNAGALTYKDRIAERYFGFA